MRDLQAYRTMETRLDLYCIITHSGIMKLKVMMELLILATIPEHTSKQARKQTGPMENVEKF